MHNLVYLVREGEDNEELRYSIRSLKNLVGKKKLIIVGFCPDWLEPDLYIKGNPHRLTSIGDKQLNVRENFLLLCNDERVPEDLVLMNDDFFITQKIRKFDLIAGVKPLNERANRLVNSWYSAALKRTVMALQAKGLGLVDFDLHAPMPFNKSKMLESLEAFPDPELAKRSVYGNHHKLKPTRTSGDNKLRSHDGIIRADNFISTADSTWPLLAPVIGSFLHEPSPWEK